MRELICRLHVIIKYFGRNKAAERFFPVMFIAFWFNIIAQCSAYLIYSYFFQSSISLALELGMSYDSMKVIAIGILFLTILSLHLIVKDANVYRIAEDWYISKSDENQFNVSMITVLFVFGLFFSLLIWALYRM